MNSFWVQWENGFISIGKEFESTPIMSWIDLEPFVVTLFGLKTMVKGLWKVGGEY